MDTIVTPGNITGYTTGKQNGFPYILLFQKISKASHSQDNQ